MAERIKRSGGHSLVNRGLAEWLIENVLLRMRMEKLRTDRAEVVRTDRKSFIPEDKEPSLSPRMGKLRWEPPKHKRDLKAHPWANGTNPEHIHHAY